MYFISSFCCLENQSTACLGACDTPRYVPSRMSDFCIAYFWTNHLRRILVSGYSRFVLRPQSSFLALISTTAKQPHNQEEAITTYKSLIRRMPKPNQYLLLYVLDLLSVFARKSDKNFMTATSALHSSQFPMNHL